MKNKNQSSKYAKIIVKKILKKNPNFNISRLYNRLRSYRRLSSLGDFFILELISSTMSEMRFPPDRNKFRYAYNQSPELKRNNRNEKRSDLNQLLNTKKSIKFNGVNKEINRSIKKVDQYIVKNLFHYNYA